MPSTVAIASGLTPSDSAAAVPLAALIGSSIGSASSQVAKTLGAGHRVDFAWPNAGLVVETDGRATHDNPHAFHTDRSRDLDLELAGWHVIRLSWPQIADEAARVAVLLAARLQETVQAGALTISPSKASKARSSEAEMQVKIGVSFSV